MAVAPDTAADLVYQIFDLQRAVRCIATASVRGQDTGVALQGVLRFVEMAAEHGPIFRLQLPGRSLIIVQSRELVDELCDEERFDKSLGSALVNVRDFAGDGLFTASEPATPANGARVVQGALEGSNVQPVMEMTTMLASVRAFEGAQRLLDTEHELERQAIERAGRAAG